MKIYRHLIYGFIFSIIFISCTPNKLFGPTITTTEILTKIQTATTVPTEEPTIIFSVSADVSDYWKGNLKVTVIKGSFIYSTGATAFEGSVIYVPENEIARQIGAVIVIEDDSNVILGGQKYTKGQKILISSNGQFNKYNGVIVYVTETSKKDFSPLKTKSYAMTTTACGTLEYIVKENDTLMGISMEYGIQLEDLMEWNPNITNDGIINKGMKIKIPLCRHK